MHAHIEEEKILTFRDISIDVSNVPYGRKVKCVKKWNEAIQAENITEKSINDMTEKVGCYLIRQPLSHLMFRLPFFEALKSYIKRLLITRRTIKKGTEKEYNDFQDWLYFVMTGNKKKDLEMDLDIMSETRKLYQILTEEMSISLEQCSELLLMLAKEQAKKSEISTSILKA